MTAETGTSKTGVIHKYYKCFGKKRKICECDKRNVRKEAIENFVFEKTKEYVLQPDVIDQIAEVVVNKFNSEITENAVVAKLNEELQEKQKAISAMLDAIEKGVFTNSTKDRLLKLENDNALLEEKIAIEQAHALKPLEKKTIVNFLKIYTNKKFESTRDKNDFFNDFILRVNLYDDRIIIVYNTSLNPATEIYKTDNKPDNDPNGGGTTIYSKTIETSEIDSNLDCRSGLNANSCNQSLSEIQNDYENEFVTENSKNTQQKSRSNSNEFKRQLFGGKTALQS